MENHKESAANGPISVGGVERDWLYLIETDYGPKTDRASLVSRLEQNQGFLEALVDRTEVLSYPNPFASLNAYKHRLQAVRCEYVSARLRAEDLEVQVNRLEGRLAEAQAALRTLEEQLAESSRETRFYRYALDQMQESRAWQLLQKWRRLRHTTAGFLRQMMGLGEPASGQPRNGEVR